jgi:hypothetical protein
MTNQGLQISANLLFEILLQKQKVTSFTRESGFQRNKVTSLALTPKKSYKSLLQCLTFHVL